RVTQERPDGCENPEDQQQVQRIDASDRQSRKPAGSPGDIKNQRNVQCRDGGHTPPKPRARPKLPLQGDYETKYRNAVEHRQHELKFAKLVEQPCAQEGASRGTDNTPPRNM